MEFCARSREHLEFHIYNDFFFMNGHMVIVIASGYYFIRYFLLSIRRFNSFVTPIFFIGFISGKINSF